MKYVEKIQKRFLYNRFIKSLNENGELIIQLSSYSEPQKYINLFQPQDDTNLRFEELKTLLSDKNIVKKFDNILQKLYRYTNVNHQVSFVINSRKFLSAWVILAFPEFVLGKSKNEINNETNYPDDIYFISKNLIEKLKLLTTYSNNPEFMRQFFKNFNQYSNAINYFLMRDRIEQINKLIDEYFDVNNTLRAVYKSDKYSIENKKNTIDAIKNTKKQILTYISKLDKNIKKQHLEVCSNFEYIKEKKIEELQFKLLIEDIDNKKFLIFNRVIDHIKKGLMTLGHTDAQINDLLDGEFISRKIAYSNFTNNDVLSYGEYMKNIINTLQAPSLVQDTNLKWEKIKLLKTETPISEYFSKVLFFVIEEITLIKENLESIVTLVNVGVDVFSL